MKENSFEQKEKPEVETRIADPKDWREFQKLRSEAFSSKDASKFGVTEQNKEEQIKEQASMGEKEWREELTGKNFGVLAWSGSDSIGMGLVERENMYWFFHSGYLREGYRGLGIGQEMFAKRLRKVQELGGGKVVMAVEVGNKESEALAKKFGFEKGEEYLNGVGFFMELKDVNNPLTINVINQTLDAG